jgi:putative flippase GtrA
MATRLGDVRSAVRALRATDSGLPGQGLRFALAGAIVTVVYVGATTLLSQVLGVRFQIALATGFGVSLMVHFTLQRTFVWAHHEDFALALGHQVGRYLAAAAAQYGVTATSSALLPSALGVSTEGVYVATVAVVISANFLVFRHSIFHARGGEPDAERAAASPASGLDH